MARKRNVPISDDQVVEAYRSLRSIPKVAEATGLGATTVNRILVRRGVERTGLAEYRATMGQPKEQPYVGVYKGSEKKILEWYAAGMSLREIAKRIGRSTHVVSRRVKRAGITRPWQASGPQHSMWAGGVVAAGSGYMRVWIAPDDPMAIMRTKSGYVLEHRLVVARILGRPLRPSESVHHLDGNRSNNAPENLQLRQGDHGFHIVMRCRACGSHDIEHAPIADPA